MPGGQTQVGMWLMTEHSAARPQVPGQGETQDPPEQAWLARQSELRTHSGRQPCRGSPCSPGAQEQRQEPAVGVLVAPGPQELAWQAESSASRRGLLQLEWDAGLLYTGTCGCCYGYCDIFISCDGK